jgi:preprotein translocase subunit SecE
MSGRDEKAKRENAMQRFFRETTGELKKVSWPTRAEALRLTWIVIGVLIIMALFLGAVDWVGSWLIAKAVGA